MIQKNLSNTKICIKYDLIETEINLTICETVDSNIIMPRCIYIKQWMKNQKIIIK